MEADASDPIEPERTRLDITTLLESSGRDFPFGVLGCADELSIPKDVASRQTASSTACSVVPSNSNTSLTKSASLNSSGMHPSVFCMSANERFNGIGAIIL